MKYLLVLISLCCCLSACSSNTDAPVSKDDILAIPDTWDNGLLTGNFQMGVWAPGRIYYTFPLSSIAINDRFELSDETHELYSSPSFISVSRDGQKMFYVNTLFSDISMGSLHIRNLLSGEDEVLLDSTKLVSSARYVGNTNDIVYYSYGSFNSNTNPLPGDAGYYIKRPGVTKDSLLLQHFSEAGPNELLNGFDITPDGKTLYYTLTFKNKAPQIVRVDLQISKRDTLPIVFDLNYDRRCLWLQLNSTATKLLYGVYPDNAWQTEVTDNSEVGVIDLPSLHKKEIRMQSPLRFSNFMALFPSWSPDDKHIVFGGGPISSDGTVGLYSLFVLKNVDRY